MSADERWMYIGAPGLNQVHAYGRVDWQNQFFRARGNGVTRIYNISDAIQIDQATQLKVTAPGISPQAFSFGGKVDPVTGIFLSESNASKGSLAGSLTMTGRQAGYLFSQPVGNGNLSGATLWGR
jgi:hypothetical protein